MIQVYEGDGVLPVEPVWNVEFTGSAFRYITKEQRVQPRYHVVYHGIGAAGELCRRLMSVLTLPRKVSIVLLAPKQTDGEGSDLTILTGCLTAFCSMPGSPHIMSLDFDTAFVSGRLS